MSDPPSWKNCVEHAALSDVGLRRSNNQDSMASVVSSSEESWRRRGDLFLVCDGMGAHAAGELASKLAVDTIPLTYHKLTDQPPAVALKRAIEDANRIIYSRGQANPDFQGMGTTSSSLLLLPQGAIVAQVGDSRVYRLRGPNFEQLSFDHSLDWELTRAGKLGGHPVPQNIPKNIITRSLGPNAEVEVDLEGPLPVLAGDVYVVCSDGLSGPVDDKEIGALVGCLPPDQAVQVLVDLANLRGGPDNITVIVARVREDLRDEDHDTIQRPETPRRRTGAATWLGLIAGLAVAAGLAIGVHPLAGLVGAVVTLVLTLLAVLMGARKPAPTAPPWRAMSHQPGPHGCWPWAPDEAFIAELVKTLQQLRNAAMEEDWKIDWGKLEGMESRAQQGVAANQYPAAVREYGGAISFMMRELKRQIPGDQQ